MDGASRCGSRQCPARCCRSTRGRSTRRCTASSSRAWSAPSGEPRRTSGRRSSTPSPPTAGNSSNAKPRIGNGWPAPSHACCRRRRPSMMRKFSTRLRSLFTRPRMEQDLDRELAFHLDMLTEQNVQAGMSPIDARRAAVQHFGAVERVKDDVRDTWLSRTWETLGQDIRYGLRSIRRTPGFALVVIVTMALGIGANTAIFSVVNAVLLRPLPYEKGEQLVVLRQQRPLAGVERMPFSVAEIGDYAKATSLASVVEFHSMWFILLGRTEPERVATGVVSANFFQTFGVTPMLGRPFAARDEAHGAPAVLILSHSYWKRSFGGDPSIIGRVFEMNDRPHEVVGVLPPVPQYPEEVDVYMPTSACPFRSNPRMVARRDGRMMSAFARIRDGVTLDKARADLDIVAARLQQDHPQFYPAAQGYTATATPL